MREIVEADFRVRLDPDTVTILFEGSIRLRPHDYEPLWSFLMEVIEGRPPVLTLDLRQLSFLNSSGINALYRLAVELRKRGGTRLVVHSNEGAWQRKSLPNLKRFLPDLEVRVGA